MTMLLMIDQPQARFTTSPSVPKPAPIQEGSALDVSLKPLPSGQKAGIQAGINRRPRIPVVMTGRFGIVRNPIDVHDRCLGCP
jgi:hypothetical protein